MKSAFKKQTESSDQWIEKIQAGDRAAFESLFRTHYAELHRFLWGYVKSTHIAEELVQDVFVRVWENRQILDPKEKIKSYLFKVAKNLAIDHVRHVKVVRRWIDEKKALHHFSPFPKGLDDKLHDKLLLKKVKRAIEELPERRRVIFMLSRYERMSYKEIAETLEISVNTVETQISRALHELRKKFASLL